MSENSKRLSNKIIGLKYSRSEACSLKRLLRELHSAHSTVENSIMTVRNKIVKGYMAAWNNMLHKKI
jgi:hypothetical protein